MGSQSGLRQGGWLLLLGILSGAAHQVAVASAACSCVHPWRSRSFETREKNRSGPVSRELAEANLRCLSCLQTALRVPEIAARL